MSVYLTYKISNWLKNVKHIIMRISKDYSNNYNKLNYNTKNKNGKKEKKLLNGH